MAMLTTIPPHLNLRFDELIVKQLKWGDVGFRGAPLHVARQKFLFFVWPPGYLGSVMGSYRFWALQNHHFHSGPTQKK